MRSTRTITVLADLFDTTIPMVFFFAWTVRVARWVPKLTLGAECIRLPAKPLDLEQRAELVIVQAAIADIIEHAIVVNFVRKFYASSG